jgi:hypothetical protein
VHTKLLTICYALEKRQKDAGYARQHKSGLARCQDNYEGSELASIGCVSLLERVIESAPASGMPL